MTNFLEFLKKTQEISPVDNSPIESIIDYFEGIDGDIIEESLASDIKDSNILIVDDNRDLLEYVSSVMEDYAKKVFTALDAYKAIDCLTTNHIDIIISDVMMPGMNGFELCNYIKRNIIISHIPVILLTARVNKESIEEGYRNGADDYITKPFKEEDLVMSVQNILRERSDERRKQLEPNRDLSQITTFSSADAEFLANFHQIVLKNASNADFSVQDAENLIQMKHTVLLNKVSQLTGLSIISYINRVRLEMAIDYMSMEDKMSMADIAKACGFSNQRYFSTAFKSYTGESPLKYKTIISGDTLSSI